jgi:hypothetical protein
MLYKTIVLELLQERPQMHEKLRQERQLLATVNRYSKELMASHEELKQQLTQAKPGYDPAQIASQAMELAIQELIERLPSESTPSDEELSLDEAIAHVRRPSPHG